MMTIVGFIGVTSEIRRHEIVGKEKNWRGIVGVAGDTRMRSDVSISVRNINDQVSAIDIGGELTSFAESELFAAVDQANQEQTSCILLNFKELTYMNSSGIGLLVTTLIRLGRQEKRLVAVELRQHFRKIFMLTKLNESIHLYDTEVEALQSEGFID